MLFTSAAKVRSDRTGERQFERELRTRKERLLLDNLRDCAVINLALKREICVWNSGAERIFGFTAAEILGVDASEFFGTAGYSSDAFRNELEVALASGRSEGESWLTQGDGTRFFGRWITNTVHAIGGGVSGFITVLLDETLRRQSEDEQQRGR